MPNKDGRTKRMSIENIFWEMEEKRTEKRRKSSRFWPNSFELVNGKMANGIPSKRAEEMAQMRQIGAKRANPIVGEFAEMKIKLVIELPSGKLECSFCDGISWVRMEIGEFSNAIGPSFSSFDWMGKSGKSKMALKMGNFRNGGRRFKVSRFGCKSI